jgi:hypothetical protein
MFFALCCKVDGKAPQDRCQAHAEHKSMTPFSISQPSSPVSQIAAVAESLPPAERVRLVVFTGDYGAAGAVDLYGAAYGLPHAISGHNNYGLRGPAGAANGATTIAINLSRR